MFHELLNYYENELPEVTKVIKKEKIYLVETDYSTELFQLKVALSTWLQLNECETEESNNQINSISNEIDTQILKMIKDSIKYIKKEDKSKKEMALFKICSAFERSKTLLNNDKKKSSNKIIDTISQDQENLKQLLNREFDELTKVGNSYSIRHSEKDQKTFPNVNYLEYFYFRFLSLVSLIIQEIE